MTNVPRAVRARRSWDSERRRQRGLLSADIAVRLGKRGHDVVAVVADSSLVGLADQQILPEAAASGRALVTANIKDFIPLGAQYKTTGRQHAGLVLVSTKTLSAGPQAPECSHRCPRRAALHGRRDRSGPCRLSPSLIARRYDGDNRS